MENVPFSSIFLKRLFKISIITSFREEFTSETIWASGFLFWKVLNYKLYIFLNRYRMIQFISSWRAFVRLSRIATFYPFCWFMFIEVFIVFTNYSLNVSNVCHDISLLFFDIDNLDFFFSQSIWLEIYQLCWFFFKASLLKKIPFPHLYKLDNSQ